MAERFPGDVRLILWIIAAGIVITLAVLPGWLVINALEWAGWI